MIDQDRKQGRTGGRDCISPRLRVRFPLHPFRFGSSSSGSHFIEVRASRDMGSPGVPERVAIAQLVEQ